MYYKVTCEETRISVRVTKQTFDKVQQAREKGKKIIINKNYRPRKEWNGKEEKLCQTNHKYYSWPKHVIWAV